LGAFLELFSSGHRRLPRVAVIEAFVENSDSSLSAPEVEKSAGVSRRATYYIIKDLVREGILVKKPKKDGAQLYALNPNDVRSGPLVYVERLLTIGRLEAEMKREEGLDQSELLDVSVLSKLRSPPRRMVPTGFRTVSPEIIFARIQEQPQPQFTRIVSGDQMQVPSLAANPRWFEASTGLASGGSAWQHN
jgi:biotin operon repressor